MCTIIPRHVCVPVFRIFRPQYFGTSEIIVMPMDLHDRIATAVLDKYAALPTKGKPRNNECTVLAAIAGVCYELDSTISPVVTVISLGTGTKCIGGSITNDDGYLIRDSHAEAIARRGFLLYLYRTISSLLHQPSLPKESRCPLEEIENGQSDSIQFRVKNNWHFYLYISDSPCGDAALYQSATSGKYLTGAKVVPGTTSSTPHSPNSLNDNSDFGAVRLKPGRSDLPEHNRSVSMSCSDKICRWICLGLQGSLLSGWLPHGVQLSGVIVSADPCAEVGEISDQQLLSRGNKSSESMGSANIQLLSGQIIALNRALRSRIMEGLKACDLNTEMKDGKNDNSVVPWSISHDVFLNAVQSLQLHVTSLESTRFHSSLAYSKYYYALSKETRLQNSTAELPEKKRQRRPNPVKICGTSINWVAQQPTAPFRLAQTNEGYSNTRLQLIAENKSPRKGELCVAGGTMEVTIAQNGILLGSTIKGAGKPSSSSRLCRSFLLNECKELIKSTRAKFLNSPPDGSISNTLEVLQGNNCQEEKFEQTYKYLKHYSTKLLLSERCCSTIEGSCDTNGPKNQPVTLCLKCKEKDDVRSQVMADQQSAYSILKSHFFKIKPFDAWYRVSKHSNS